MLVVYYCVYWNSQTKFWKYVNSVTQLVPHLHKSWPSVHWRRHYFSQPTTPSYVFFFSLLNSFPQPPLTITKYTNFQERHINYATPKTYSFHILSLLVTARTRLSHLISATLIFLPVFPSTAPARDIPNRTTLLAPIQFYKIYHSILSTSSCHTRQHLTLLSVYTSQSYFPCPRTAAVLLYYRWSLSAHTYIKIFSVTHSSLASSIRTSYSNALCTHFFPELIFVLRTVRRTQNVFFTSAPVYYSDGASPHRKYRRYRRQAFL